MEENKEGEGPSERNSTSTPSYKRVRIPKVEVESVGKDCEKQKNPLDIPEVIAVVAAHISEVNDLKGVRTQSKAWRDETLLKWRNEAVFLINDETIPILVKAFEQNDLADLSEDDKTTILKEKDPLGLQQVPFKNYRFANARNGQPWSYPLDKNDVAGKIIWDEVISPHATYLDVGECVLRKFFYPGNWTDFGASYLPGLNWILKHSPNVSDLAMAPLQSSHHVLNLFDSESGEEKEVTEVRKRLQLEVECRTEERSRMVGGRFTQEDSHQKFIRRTVICTKIERAVEASRLQSFTISTPQLAESFVRDESTTLEPLINCKAKEGIRFIRWIFAGMNLKHLQLPTGFSSTSLFKRFSTFSNSTQLESLTVLAAPPHSLPPDQLNRFISWACPPLRELRMGIKCRLSSSNFVFNNIFRSLRLIQETIEKLEFAVYCEQEKESKSVPVNFSLGKESTFLNLTQLKITLDYENFQEFHFELNKMPKLQSFQFGKNKKVFQGWTDRKLEGTFVGNVDEMNEADEKLPSLKEFHFNGNLTRNALLQVGKMTKKLNTLELVLDQENLPALQEICPRLKKLTLLPGSKVPEEVMHSLKKSYQCLDIIDKSEEK